ncbi:hypothetical protein EMCG_03230 [[Emmonsia] crescens]|uniref:AAA+ ATPase domain-containing protein n=1 Tax=[Emmonsia] crescens TaxID=73230 RepID=A0A0G2HWA1_9EURO|nr:hypothetical protein EMCG_03230 [Emmonsia crescens UAMH 3008]
MNQVSSLVGSLLNTIFPGSIFIDTFLSAPNLGLLSNILIVGCAFVYVCIWVYDGIWKFCAVEVEIEPRSEEHEHLTTFLECWVTGCLSRRVRSEEWSEEDAPERTEWDWKTVGALRQYRFRPNKICLFLFGGSVFQFRRMERSFEFYSEERYSLRVLGWSCKPIERLLAEARSRHISKSKSKITIFSPGGKPVLQTRNPWRPVKSTSRRSLESISLAKGRKEEVCNDMYSFLNARSAYAKTERPYRRGYLFNGPPGTGKTSLALALAGKFGLDIYTLSLTGQKMTDDDLQWLCSHLPRRCILLIEDIDSAGINREKTRATPQDSARQNNQVSLSGLLNAIDGVSSSDGRILVMTTNCRDQLDAALIRPGRVDMEVEFTLASKEQVKSIFQHMYTPEGDTKPTDMATEFANRVPDCQYSPADIQNSLWKHNDPNRAVTEAQEQFPMKEKHLSDNLSICSTADDGIEIIWENDNPRPKVRITSDEILDAVSVPGRHTHTLYQPPGAIYHDLLNAGLSRNQSFAAAIQRIREALDQELYKMKTKGDIGKHYWTEMIYRRFLGSYRIHHVEESVLPAAEDTGTIEVTLSGISPQDRGFLLRFTACDVNNLPLFTAVTFEDIQHLHQRGAIFLRNHEEMETSGFIANISIGG